MPRPIPAELLDDGAAYVSERKIYPRDVDGRFQRLRTAAVFWLLGMYYLFPWLRWDGRQAVLFDLPARKFYIFGLSFWPQDFFYLALLLVLAGLSLFFFTALAGRLWCGYACPQTVWTDVFLWMERWTEGDRAARMKLDAAPWSPNKLRRKLAKHGLWFLFALWTGVTFVGFFTPIRDLAARLWPFAWSGWESFWVLFYALATWGNAGVLREQVCKYMCPYARFQSAMFDRNTLIIAYDPMRGEPRGARRKGRLASVLGRARGLLPIELAERLAIAAYRRAREAGRGGDSRATTALVVDDLPALLSQGGDPAPAVSATDAGSGSRSDAGASRHKQAPNLEELGDCIDCTICVQVCPTGIDIRNGLQYECIACGACVDACDEVMAKIGYPQGLVRYTTQNAMEGRPQRLLRPRVLVYGGLLALVAAGFVAGIALREPLIVDVLRDRQLYRTADDGSVENSYILRVINKDTQPHRYRVTLQDAVGLQLRGATGQDAIIAAPEEVLTVPVTVSRGKDVAGGPTAIRFEVVDLDTGLRVSEESRFIGPTP